MCTDSSFRKALWACLCALWINSAAAEKVQTTKVLADDLEIDRALSALRAPVLHIIPNPGEGEKGAPLWPLYKQEVAKGQTDFRPVITPTETQARKERSPASKPKPQPAPNPNPQPQPQPCTPNSPNWPNCLQQP